MKIFLTLGFFTICLSLVFGQLSAAEVQLADGYYEIALDEVQRHPADGGLPQPMTQRKKSSLQTLVNDMNYRALVTGERCDLVLYRKGEKGTERSRRVLSRQILIQLEDGASSALIPEAAGAIDFSEPSYAPNCLFLKFAGMGDSLMKLSKIRDLEGVLSAEPLMGKSASNVSPPMTRATLMRKRIGVTNGI